MVTPASLNVRVLASLWDYLGMLVLGGVWILLGPSCFCLDGNVALINALLFGAFMCPILIPNLIKIVTNSQSIGKRRVGLLVVRPNGERCHPARYLILRTLPQFAVFLVAWVVDYPLWGLVGMMADALLVLLPGQRCLHDWLSDSVVVQA